MKEVFLFKGGVLRITRSLKTLYMGICKTFYLAMPRDGGALKPPTCSSKNERNVSRSSGSSGSAATRPWNRQSSLPSQSAVIAVGPMPGQHGKWKC